MDFFDGLIEPDPPDEPQPETHHRLGSYPPRADESLAPADWFVPAQLPQVIELGAGPEVRVMLTAWQVRPAPKEAPPRPTLRLKGGGGGGFHHQVELHLSQLPPEGSMQLVVEWPDQGVPETRTEIDATALRAAAADVVRIRPETAPPPPEEHGDEPEAFTVVSTGPSEIMAQAVVGPARRRGGRPAAPPPQRERGDWKAMGHAGWQDVDLVRARLAHGADPLAELDSWSGETPCTTPRSTACPRSSPNSCGTSRTWRWKRGKDAPRCGRRSATAAGRAELLLAAGADAWSPQTGGRSPGRLALTTELAPLFEALPNAVPLTPEERAAQEDADLRAAVFHDIHLGGHSIAFVAEIDEETAIRRLGADPAATPVLDLDREPGRYGTGPHGFDPDDHELAERFVGVTGVPGGCVLIHPAHFRVSTPHVLNALSPGTTAYGLYFNAKGGTFGDFSRDGRSECHEEIGFVFGDEPGLHWLYRFWRRDKPSGMWGAHEVAYASHRGGVRVTDRRAVEGPPRRWAEIPRGSELLA